MATLFSIDVDQFNVICGLVSLVSFIFGAVVYFTDRGFKRYMEASLLSLIGTLDKAAAMEGQDHFDASHIAIVAADARDQAIGLLRSFSRKNERLETFNFGIAETDPEEIRKKRKQATGVTRGGGGCIVSGQMILAGGSELSIDDVAVGSEIDSFDESSGVVRSCVLKKSSHIVECYYLINGTLALTGNHLVFTKASDWLSVDQLSIGDQIMKSSGDWEIISMMELRSGQFKVYAIETGKHNLFSNRYLVHNVQK